MAARKKGVVRGGKHVEDETALSSRGSSGYRLRNPLQSYDTPVPISLSLLSLHSPPPLSLSLSFYLSICLSISLSQLVSLRCSELNVSRTPFLPLVFSIRSSRKLVNYRLSAWPDLHSRLPTTEGAATSRTLQLCTGTYLTQFDQSIF